MVYSINEPMFSSVTGSTLSFSPGTSVSMDVSSGSPISVSIGPDIGKSVSMSSSIVSMKFWISNSSSIMCASGESAAIKVRLRDVKQFQLLSTSSLPIFSTDERYLSSSKYE